MRWSRVRQCFPSATMASSVAADIAACVNRNGCVTTRWTTMVSSPPILEGYVPTSIPHTALMLILTVATPMDINAQMSSTQPSP